MKKKLLVCMLGAFVLCVSSTVYGQDTCDKLFNKYRICVEQSDAGSNMDYEVCKTFTDQTSCEGAGCYWKAENSACMINMCLMDGSLDGQVKGGDLGMLKKEYGRNDCPTTPEIPANPMDITCEGTLSPLKRWCDQGNCTVKDMTTGLVWLKDANWGGLKPWEDCTTHDDAHTRAGTLYDGMAGEPAGLSDGSIEGDWRLPTKSELVGITVGDEYIRSDSNPKYFFDNVQEFFYWSSTTNSVATSFAYDVNMLNGTLGFWEKSDYYGDYVWPVRVEVSAPPPTCDVFATFGCNVTSIPCCDDYGDCCCCTDGAGTYVCISEADCLAGGGNTCYSD